MHWCMKMDGWYLVQIAGSLQIPKVLLQKAYIECVLKDRLLAPITKGSLSTFESAESELLLTRLKASATANKATTPDTSVFVPIVKSWNIDRLSIAAASTTTGFPSSACIFNEGEANTDNPPTGSHHPISSFISKAIGHPYIQYTLPRRKHVSELTAAHIKILKSMACSG